MVKGGDPLSPLDLSSGELDLSKTDSEETVEEETKRALRDARQRTRDLDGDRRWIVKALFIFVSALVLLAVVPALFDSASSAADRAFEIFKIAFPSLTLAIGYYFAKDG